MTELELALQSPNEMAAYLEIRNDVYIIADIKAMQPNTDRVKIATAAMQGILASGKIATTEVYTVADLSIRQADKLIPLLNRTT